ncbi:hypothetical protein H8959_012731 [Pygathrix nigripes]
MRTSKDQRGPSPSSSTNLPLDFGQVTSPSDTSIGKEYKETQPRMFKAAGNQEAAAH